MKYAVVLLAVSCLLSSVHAQWLETTIAVGGGPWDLMYVPSVNKVYCANDDPPSISIIDCAANTVLATISMSYNCVPLTWSDTYKRVYIGSQADRRGACGGREAGSSVVVIDAVGDTVVADLPSYDNPATAAYCRTLDKVYVMCDGSVSGVDVIDAARDSIVKRISFPIYADGTCWCPTTNLVFFANDRGDSMRVIDCTNDQVRAVQPGHSSFDQAFWNRVDGRVYTSEPYAFHVFSAAGDRLIGSIAHPAYTPGLCFAPYPNKCYIGDFNTGTTYIVDCNTVAIVDSFQTDQVDATVVDTISGRLYIAHPRDGVTVIDAQADSVVKFVQLTDYPSGGIAWSPPSRRVYVPGYYSGKLYVIRDSAVGVEESRNSQASCRRPEPTILTGAGVQGLKSSVIFDATGRRVVSPKPGVYFVCEEPQASSHKPQDLRKVVITR